MDIDDMWDDEEDIEQFTIRGLEKLAIPASESVQCLSPGADLIEQQAKRIKRQSAALKLARAALTDWLTTDLDEQQCWQALAAIDALEE